MATCTTLQTTLRVPHSNRLHVNLCYIYQPPNGSTFASADSGLARIDRRHALALMSILSPQKLIFPSFFTLTRFFSPRLPSAMSSIYDKGTGCERVPHWATRLCRWALCLAAPFPAFRGSIPLCQAFIANAVAPRGPALRGTRIPVL